MFKVRKNNKLEKNHVFEDALSFHNLFYGWEGGNALTSLNLCWNNLGSEEILHVDFSGSQWNNRLGTEGRKNAVLTPLALEIINLDQKEEQHHVDFAGSWNNKLGSERRKAIAGWCTL